MSDYLVTIISQLVNPATYNQTQGLLLQRVPLVKKGLNMSTFHELAKEI